MHSSRMAHLGRAIVKDQVGIFCLRCDCRMFKSSCRLAAHSISRKYFGCRKNLKPSEINRMKTFSLLGRGVLILVSACLALGCSKLAASQNQANAATTPVAVTAPPTPAPTQNPEDKMPRISAEEAKKLVDAGKAVLIDVRSSDAYKISHIKGALEYPLSKIEAKDFSGLPKINGSLHTVPAVLSTPALARPMYFRRTRNSKMPGPYWGVWRLGKAQGIRWSKRRLHPQSKMRLN